ALLRRRILFYHNPPVEILCSYVFCTTLLTSNTLQPHHHASMNIKLSSSPEPATPTSPHPLFYVNVSNIQHLSTLSHYIACTTETIFESKTTLFDLFIRNKSIVFSPNGTPKIKETDTDKVRFDRLKMFCGIEVQKSNPTSPLSPESVVSETDTIEVISNEASSPIRPTTRATSMRRRGLVRSLSAKRERDKEWTSEWDWISAFDKIREREKADRDDGFGRSEDVVLKALEFFHRLNTNLMKNLLEIAASPDPFLRPCRIRALLGLHPTQDLAFLKELIRVYDIKLEITNDHKTFAKRISAQLRLFSPGKSLSSNIITGTSTEENWNGRDHTALLCCPVPEWPREIC
ncbi:hypothetical protein HK096_000369, partial [Nowakowskiella sp. JEL0078]